MPNVTALYYCCEQINIRLRQLIRDIEHLENVPDDEAAYSIMSGIKSLAEFMDGARRAGSDDRGYDVLDAYETVANAIRSIKEAP